ncbi:MAG: hypothetical protein Tsb0014_36030 [Pleurocapsa sp.]
MIGLAPCDGASLTALIPTREANLSLVPRTEELESAKVNLDDYITRNNYTDFSQIKEAKISATKQIIVDRTPI